MGVCPGKQRWVAPTIGILMILALAAAFACTTVQPIAGTPGLDGEKVTIQGKIAFMEKLGGYYIQSEGLSGEFIIDNPDPIFLGELFKSQKTLLIEGHYTIGAEHVFIEKIDGKSYRGKEPARIRLSSARSDLGLGNRAQGRIRLETTSR